MTRYFTFERGGSWFVHVWHRRENHGPFGTREQAYAYAGTLARESRP